MQYVFLSFAEVAERLRVDEKTIRKWVNQANMRWVADEADGRRRLLTEQQVSQLAEMHRRNLPRGTERDAALQQEMAAIRAQLEDLAAKLDEVSQKYTALDKRQSRVERLAGALRAVLAWMIGVSDGQEWTVKRVAERLQLPAQALLQAVVAERSRLGMPLDTGEAVDDHTSADATSDPAPVVINMNS